MDTNNKKDTPEKLDVVAPSFFEKLKTKLAKNENFAIIIGVIVAVAVALILVFIFIFNRKTPDNVVNNFVNYAKVGDIDALYGDFSEKLQGDVSLDTTRAGLAALELDKSCKFVEQSVVEDNGGSKINGDIVCDNASLKAEFKVNKDNKIDNYSIPIPITKKED